MNQGDQDLKRRRSVIAGMGVAVAGLTVGGATSRAQTPAASGAATGFQPMRHNLDAWMDELPGNHRIFIDTSTAHGGAEALLYANNIFSAHEGAYSGQPADLAMLVCFRHFSTPFGYGDEIWEKYGATFHSIMQFPDPATEQAPRINLMNSPAHTTLPNFGFTIDFLVAKDTRFAICNNATRFFSGQVAAAHGTLADDGYEELVAGAIPNSRFVSAGVMAMTRAQEYGYSLLYAG